MTRKMATFARAALLVCALTLHCVAGAPLRPLTAEETVREYLDNGGHEKIRRALNLSHGVTYDPFATFSRDNAPPGQGFRSRMTLSDIDIMRKMGHFVPGHDDESLLVSMRERLHTLSRQQSETVRGLKSVYTVQYAGGPPPSARRAFNFALQKWADTFPCKVPLRVLFEWVNMGDRTLAAANSPFNVIGSSSTLRYDTAYTPTLAAAISGQDKLSRSLPHISVSFNRQQYWHTEPKTPTPREKYDLATVALHEQCHGLFFSGALQLKRNSRDRGEFRSANELPSRFDHFMTTSEGRGIAKTCSERKLFQAITTPGLKIRTIVGGSSFRLYAPPKYQPGSSTYHFSAGHIGRDCEIFNISQAECSDLMTFELTNGYQQLSIGQPALRVMRSVLSQNSGVKQEGKCIIPPPTMDNDPRRSGVLGKFGSPIEAFKLPRWVIIVVASIGASGALIVLYFVGCTLVKG